MGATSRIVAAVMIGLTVTGCGLTRQAEREAAQRAADDTRCRSYGFRNDADLARCRMQLDLARLLGGSASGVLESVVTRTNGTPIWRLYPTHATCIALLTVQKGDLLVLAICNRAEVEVVEQTLINC
jgi:hypothetical protein